MADNGVPQVGQIMVLVVELDGVYQRLFQERRLHPVTVVCERRNAKTGLSEGEPVVFAPRPIHPLEIAALAVTAGHAEFVGLDREQVQRLVHALVAWLDNVDAETLDLRFGGDRHG